MEKKYVDYSEWAGVDKLIKLDKGELLEKIVPIILATGKVWNYQINLASGRRSYTSKYMERMEKKEDEIIESIMSLYDQFWNKQNMMEEPKK